MKWKVLLATSVLLIGCATPPKHKPVHHTHHKTTKVTVVGHDDAAIKAIIKSLRE